MQHSRRNRAHSTPSEIDAGADPVRLIGLNGQELGFSDVNKAVETANKFGLKYEEPNAATATQTQPDAPGVSGRETRQETAQPQGPSAPLPVAPGATPRTYRPAADEFGTEITPAAAHVINDIGGILSKSAAIKSGRYKGNADLWDGADAEE